ncbi:MAG: hypothetical protein GKR88_01750 [Flavobacteriaceae bacterium]|nr:MAG: hypothetical protein GKR88_01750 [Flavobacteriaceae bacterium]
MKKIIICFLCIVVNAVSYGQIAIGTTTPSPSAVLDVNSTTQGFLPPRMTKAQIDAIASPAEGLIVYCTNCNAKGLYLNNGNEFLNVTSGTSIFASEVAAIVAASDNPADGNPSIADLTSAGLTGLVAGNLGAYEIAIDAATPAPTTVAELQTIINNVNVSEASAAVLAQISSDEDSATQNSTVTIAQLNLIVPALTGINAANETAYRNYIDANPNSFSSPATQTEVQAMILLVNNSSTVSTVVGAGGGIFMDRNLGATQVATSSNDSNAFGDLSMG